VATDHRVADLLAQTLHVDALVVSRANDSFDFAANPIFRVLDEMGPKHGLPLLQLLDLVPKGIKATSRVIRAIHSLNIMENIRTRIRIGDCWLRTAKVPGFEPRR
jgi:hypothetical protein